MQRVLVAFDLMAEVTAEQRTAVFDWLRDQGLYRWDFEAHEKGVVLPNTTVFGETSLGPACHNISLDIREALLAIVGPRLTRLVVVEVGDKHTWAQGTPAQHELGLLGALTIGAQVPAQHELGLLGALTIGAQVPARHELGLLAALIGDRY